MAFLYGGGQTADDDQGKQNIFGAEAAPGAGEASAGGAVLKTSGGGGAQRGTSQVTASSGGSSQPQTASTGGYNPKAAQSAYGRLSAQIRLPNTTLQGAQSSIQQGQQQLQDASNA